MRGQLFTIVLFVFLAVSCSAPRSITHSGMVPPKGHVKAGGNMVASLSSETVYRLGLLNADAIKSLSNRDSVYLDRQIDNISAALISYALEPSGINYDLYLRYGAFPKLDVGYKYAL